MKCIAGIQAFREESVKVNKSWLWFILGLKWGGGRGPTVINLQEQSNHKLFYYGQKVKFKTFPRPPFCFSQLSNVCVWITTSVVCMFSWRTLNCTTATCSPWSAAFPPGGWRTSGPCWLTVGCETWRHTASLHHQSLFLKKTKTTWNKTHFYCEVINVLMPYLFIYWQTPSL